MGEIMADDKKSVKVNCSFCAKEIECPENMLDSKKHMCYDCFQNVDELAKGEDLGKVHVDLPLDKMDEIFPENMTNSLVEEAFPDVWSERKEELKDLSKKDLAKEMFGIGAYIAIRQMLDSMKETDEDEKG